MAETRMGPDNVAYTGDIVPEGYTQELYDFLTSVDPSFSQDLNVQQFQEALESDDNYARAIRFAGNHLFGQVTPGMSTDPQRAVCL